MTATTCLPPCRSGNQLVSSTALPTRELRRALIGIGHRGNDTIPVVGKQIRVAVSDVPLALFSQFYTPPKYGQESIATTWPPTKVRSPLHHMAHAQAIPTASLLSPFQPPAVGVHSLSCD